MEPPAIALLPRSRPEFDEAVRRGGGRVARPEGADGLVWLDPRDPEGLRQAIAASPRVRWVQLPFAGVENFVATGVLDPRVTWTCAKGIFAEPVAEHALMLALAGLRDLKSRARALSWGVQGGESLFDVPVTILGGGGIAMSLVELLVPFRCPVTIVRRNPQPVTGVRSVVGSEELDGALAGSRVLFVALALTPQTVGIVDRRRMALLGSDGGLVNVARGRHVITADLVAALEAGEIGFAGLDVTDPEPLPQSHPLWAHPSCLITPHTANSAEMAVSFLAAQISRNVANFAEGRPLEGLVDLAAGY